MATTTDDEALLLRSSRLTIHRQLNPNYCGAGGTLTAVADQLGLGSYHPSCPAHPVPVSVSGAYHQNKSHSSSKSDGDLESDEEKSWDRREGGNVVAKRNARERTRVHTVNQVSPIFFAAPKSGVHIAQCESARFRRKHPEFDSQQSPEHFCFAYSPLQPPTI